ncbi:hypothetical protein RTCIAT899_PC01070 (plasmid) [Rhizobium tropici CIAT 899]|nr:hypothetical protein RTCIAT899_PC01070 [Rhizobium tropici CIAT 899]
MARNPWSRTISQTALKLRRLSRLGSKPVVKDMRQKLW